VRRSRWQRPRFGPPLRLGGAGLARADADLLRVIDRDFAAVAAKAGDWLACAPGCSECCIGPFPITRLDVRRLSAGMARLETDDPRLAAEVRRRASRAVEQLADRYPGDATSGRLTEDERTLDRFFERHGAMPCPGLDPERGHCDLYAWRPVSCRTYGPPVRFGDELAPPCRLCFDGAPAASVERCRMAPDREGREQRILAAMGVVGGEDWETLIAYALLD
jgi:Fe-S-cluster containining protein